MSEELPWGQYIIESPSAGAPIVDIDISVPVFIGRTARADRTRVLEPTKIDTLDEYHSIFGGRCAEPAEIVVSGTVGNPQISLLTPAAADPPKAPTPHCLLPYSLWLYFANGGGTCFILSVGPYEAGSPVRLRADDDGEDSAFGLLDGLDALAERTEGPRLILIPDAVHLPDTEYSDLARSVLAHCSSHGRFAILDIPGGSADLRGVGGAGGASALESIRHAFGESGLANGAVYYPFVHTSQPLECDEASVAVSVDGVQTTLSALRSAEPQLHASIAAALTNKGTLLPPGGAVAGAYVTTDRISGVWKAPANVALVQVTAPAVPIDDNFQQLLNVDAATGKSINAIRYFAGKGSLIWGARTLAGNDLEWRYVPVRRLFLLLSESIRHSTRWATFESNSPETWTALRRQTEDYLYRKWKSGAFQGTKPEQAYFVRCGLGQTMTQADIDNGRLLLEVAFAPVRPAEFVIIRIEQLMEPTKPVVPIPPSKRRYLVDWEGVRMSFGRITGLGGGVPGGAAKSHRGRGIERLPGHPVITLRSGVVEDYDRFSKLVAGGAGRSLRMTVTVLDERGDPVQRWRILNPWPVKYAGPTLDATGSEVAIETLEISNEGIELEE